MKFTPTLTGLAALVMAVGIGVPATAYASGTVAGAEVDGVIVVSGNTCSWTGADASATPPSALTVDRSTINKPGGNLTCGGGITASLNNNPAFTFDDAAGTATTDVIDLTGKQSFVSCRYKVTNIVWNRDGATRKYVNTPFTATKVSGSFLCPGSFSAAAGEASVVFR
ncbi:hypothetical protein ACFY8C_05970 [Streptomyces flavochromogenes]|uniref:Secreted protein n=1 Tax=Streptomyces flavochromogenes TaxID=68199 RepID=A0ABW6XK63_9ACTN|nr:hypothetical protein [Streptomyces flavochromogenes]